MAMSIRAKRVSDPLDDKVKARLRGEGGSSGSEHEAADAFFSGPIHAFFDMGVEEPQPDDRAAVVVDGDDGESDDHSSGDAEAICRLLDRSRGSDALLPGRLRSDVAEIVEALGGGLQGPCHRRRAAMARLREYGYNAGICKARWEGGGGGLTGGSYEYIDVVVEEERYIVDVEFAAEFEVARATEEYRRLAAALPRAMVGRCEEVKKVVRVMAEAAKRSMRSKGLEVPPWRKRRYMLAKWLGPYRRTVNPLPAAASSSPAAAATGGGGGEMINFRAVGFGNVVALTS